MVKTLIWGHTYRSRMPWHYAVYGSIMPQIQHSLSHKAGKRTEEVQQETAGAMARGGGWQGALAVSQVLFL